MIAKIIWWINNMLNDKEMYKVRTGDLAKDRITGYTGVVECVSEWLNQCRRITIVSQELHDGKPVGNCTFDEPQIEVIEPGYFYKSIPKMEGRTGGSSISPSRVIDPK